MSTSQPTPRVSPSDASGFHLFSQLPPELRLRVWKHNLPRGRVVPIVLDSTPQDRRGYLPRQPSQGCNSPAHIPRNLHICHEARSEALKHYILSFGVCQGPGQIFFNPDEDILYFGAHDDQWEMESQFRLFTTMVEPEELAHVRRIAINDAIFWPEPEYISSIAARLTIDVLDTIRARLPNLEELIFVPRGDNVVYRGDTTLAEPETRDLRLLRQIHEGMQAVAQTHPEWRAPLWSVKVLKPLTRNSIYDSRPLAQHQYQRKHQAYDEMEGIETGTRLGNMDQGVLKCFSGF